MYAVRQEELPLKGMSYNFVGADHGDTKASVYIVNAPPGRGAPPHRHPYDEIVFVQAGSGRWTVNGTEIEGTSGDIFVVKAGEIHSFINIGEDTLRLFDVHTNARFEQENITQEP
ncbi:MAG: cupin domain-containing protein [Gemmatimonadota bacterium]